MSTAGGLPEPRFELLVDQLFAQAMIELGEIPNPVTGRSGVAVDRARFTIGMLGVLEEKTRGNLTPAEARRIEQALAALMPKLAAAETGGDD
jgi:hypothetical protein